MTVPRAKNGAGVKAAPTAARMTSSGTPAKPKAAVKVARHVLHAPAVAVVSSPFDWKTRTLSLAEAATQAKVTKQVRLAETQRLRRVAAKRLLASTGGAGLA